MYVCFGLRAWSSAIWNNHSYSMNFILRIPWFMVRYTIYIEKLKFWLSSNRKICRVWFNRHFVGKCNSPFRIQTLLYSGLQRINRIQAVSNPILWFLVHTQFEYDSNLDVYKSFVSELCLILHTKLYNIYFKNFFGLSTYNSWHAWRLENKFMQLVFTFQFEIWILNWLNNIEFQASNLDTSKDLILLLTEYGRQK